MYHIILTYIVLRFNVPVNNFSVMSERRHIVMGETKLLEMKKQRKKSQIFQHFTSTSLTWDVHFEHITNNNDEKCMPLNI